MKVQAEKGENRWKACLTVLRFSLSSASQSDLPFSDSCLFNNLAHVLVLATTRCTYVFFLDKSISSPTVNRRGRTTTVHLHKRCYSRERMIDSRQEGRLSR